MDIIHSVGCTYTTQRAAPSGLASFAQSERLVTQTSHSRGSQVGKTEWFGRFKWSRRSRPAGAPVLAMLLVAGVIVIATRQEGMSAQAVELGTGSVWVTSNGPGQMALLDGASAQVAVRLRVAQDGDDVLAVQGRNAGYAVNRTNGTVRRVDTATWHTGPPTILIDGSSAELTAVTSDQKMFA